MELHTGLVAVHVQNLVLRYMSVCTVSSTAVGGNWLGCPHSHSLNTGSVCVTMVLLLCTETLPDILRMELLGEYRYKTQLVRV